MEEICTLKLGFANAFLIKGQKGAVLVDTGFQVTREQYLKAFANYHLMPEDIQLILITHGHGDHFFGVSELKKMIKAPLLCHKNAVYALQTGQNAPVIPRNSLGQRVWNQIRNHVPTAKSRVQPDLVMGEIFDLAPYGIAGKVIYTPGHTDCSVSVVLDSGNAIVGDILVPSPYTGETCLAYFAYREKILFECVETLLQAAHTFYGSHGGPFSRTEVQQALIKENRNKSVITTLKRKILL